MRSHVGCGTVQQIPFLHVIQKFDRRKSDANKQDFEMNLNWTYQGQPIP